jgi:hypothetical protein
MFIASSNLCDIAGSEARIGQNITFDLSPTRGHNTRIHLKGQLLWARSIKSKYHTKEGNEESERRFYGLTGPLDITCSLPNWHKLDNQTFRMGGLLEPVRLA